MYLRGFSLLICGEIKTYVRLYFLLVEDLFRFKHGKASTVEIFNGGSYPFVHFVIRLEFLEVY